MEPTTQLERWEDTCESISKHFYLPDLEGVLVTNCVATAHYYRADKPVWLQVVGASGSGKTELLVDTLGARYPDSRTLSNITTKAFLSAASGTKNELLPPTGGSKLWWIKDLTTMYSQRQDDRKEIAASFREIWDGKLTRDTGVGPTLLWSGKVTTIAMATPDAEQYWGSLRGLGERFMTLRWRSATTEIDRLLTMEASRKQIGRGAEIRKEIGDKWVKFQRPKGGLGGTLLLIPEGEVLRSVDIASDILSNLRRNVRRDYDMRRSILGVDTAELPTRIAAGMAQIVRAHQALFQGEVTVEQSIQLVKRVVVDSIPIDRALVIKHIPLDGSGIPYDEILRIAGLPRAAVQRAIEEMVEMGVLIRSTEKEWGDNIADYTPKFGKWMALSGMDFSAIQAPRAAMD